MERRLEMGEEQTVRLHLRYAGKGEPVVTPSEVILPYEKYEELQAESDRLRGLLRRAHDDAENHGHCPSCCMEGTGFSLFNWKYRGYVHADGCELAAECNG